MGLWAVRHRRLLALCATAFVVAFAGVLRLGLGGPFVARAIDDVVEFAVPALAAVPCLWRALASSGRLRLSWLLFGAALGSWSAGQMLWSYYELIAVSEPFPSPADIGFLLFPVLALAGLLVRPSAAFAGSGRLRILLDGTMVVASLFILTWSTSLGAVFHAGSEQTLAFVVGLCYPGADLVLVTVAILVVIRARVRLGLLLLVGGLVSMAVADSAFAYMQAAGTYYTGAYSDVAWVAAFLMIGLAALFPQGGDDVAGPRVESLLSVALPYGLVLGGALITVDDIISNTAASVTLSVEAVALVALLARQLVTVLDNRRLAINVLEQQEELRFRAFHDALTGLANRALFYDRVAHALQLHDRDLRPVSVVFVDLDDFKAVNDDYGHDAGDALLTAVAARLQGALRTGDTIARLGGDEFAILLEDDGDTALLAERLLSALAVPAVVKGRTIPIRASIGMTTLDPAEGNTDIEELLKRADLAMYAAKRKGKGTSVAYTPELRAHDDGDLDQRSCLAADIRADVVRTAFQPIVTANGLPFAFQALARWSYRGAEMVPAQFMALAARARLLNDLELLMVKNSLTGLANVRRSHDRLLVAVTVGLQRVHDGDFPERLKLVLADFGVPSRDLVIEVAETDALDESRTVAAFDTLHELGVTVALDDFGIGHSNLNRLNRLHPDIVKLDRSFVDALKHSGAPTRVVAGVINLAHDLEATVIAEGVETERQFASLGALGCDAMQGLWVGKPVSELGPIPETDSQDRPLGVA